MINQFGNIFTGSASVIGIIFAATILIGMIYMLARPYKESIRLSAKVK